MQIRALQQLVKVRKKPIKMQQKTDTLSVARTHTHTSEYVVSYVSVCDATSLHVESR